jgi:isoaspartyl peptidase/L-asparaginase-like protein (Ntn-hydrolase superfamily)
MADETLFTAARRVVREFNIMMNHDGGLVSRSIEMAINTLDLETEKERAKQKRNEEVQERNLAQRQQTWPRGQKPQAGDRDQNV